MGKSRSRTRQTSRSRDLKIIVEKHPDGFVAYPLGMRGVCIGQGDTYEEALTDVRSAIRFHIATFGAAAFADDAASEAFVAELRVAG
ncbi:MAG: type II toxin-antitoxin system HicB family antitoxin [Chloroflexi bacterium]|nr:type II toxin-antitoxin system HicB family antitoxin [Chloroflexota bacterium]